MANVFERLRGKRVVLLRPRAARAPLPPGASKMGGAPDLPPDFVWPDCPHCAVRLDFILQIRQKHVPEFPFPKDGRDQFVLFRCPARQCVVGIERHLVWAYVSASRCVPHPHPPPLPATATIPSNPLTREDFDDPSSMKVSEHIYRDFDAPIPECSLHLLRTRDYPIAGDDCVEWWGEVLAELELSLWLKVREGTKVAGFAAWQQGAQYKQCRCGRQKQFVFQLASEEPNPDRKKALEDTSPQPLGPPYWWSPHGIEIGDAGNIYFLTCPSCGPETMEIASDCG